MYQVRCTQESTDPKLEDVVCCGLQHLEDAELVDLVHDLDDLLRFAVHQQVEEAACTVGHTYILQLAAGQTGEQLGRTVIAFAEVLGVTQIC